MDIYDKVRVEEYRKIRERILQRDEFQCKRCKKYCKRTELVVHHIKRRFDGGDDNPKNLITLCTRCHITIHRRYNPHRRDMVVNQKEVLAEIFEALGDSLY